ncbi:uncharacterized protein SRS1_15526 [Sporisorium reilianum f. sp. reilianum]|uniref:Uncharacterized protein n=1 Tax=Sporisorium reilianum f. sp. reilianum TaxID=72559 RepID=A0A2N8UIU5_9BASI|nr:uncharacterized protein SRS1_15526 [Sporisorium reilianum f. sp. reilianum]
MAVTHTAHARPATPAFESRYTHRYSTWSRSTDSLVSAISLFPSTPSTPTAHQASDSDTASNGSQETLVPRRRPTTPAHPAPVSPPPPNTHPARNTLSAELLFPRLSHQPYRPRPTPEHLRTQTYELEAQLMQLRLHAASLVHELQLHMAGAESKLDELVLGSIRRAATHALEAGLMVCWYRESKLRDEERERKEEEGRRNGFEAAERERPRTAGEVVGASASTRVEGVQFPRRAAEPESMPALRRGLKLSLRSSTAAAAAAASTAQHRAADPTHASSLALASHARRISLAYTATAAAAHSSQQRLGTHEAERTRRGLKLRSLFRVFSS